MIGLGGYDRETPVRLELPDGPRRSDARNAVTYDCDVFHLWVRGAGCGVRRRSLFFVLRPESGVRGLKSVLVRCSMFVGAAGERPAPYPFASERPDEPIDILCDKYHGSVKATCGIVTMFFGVRYFGRVRGTWYLVLGTWYLSCRSPGTQQLAIIN